MLTRIPNNVERKGGGGGHAPSTSLNIRDNKRNIEWLLKQSLQAFKTHSASIQLGFNMFEDG